MNLYAFVLNAPTNLTDPLGEISFFGHELLIPEGVMAGLSIAGGLAQWFAGSTLTSGSGGALIPVGYILYVQGASNIGEGATYFATKLGFMDEKFNFLRWGLESAFNSHGNCSGTIIYYTAEFVTGGVALWKTAPGALDALEGISTGSMKGLKTMTQARKTYALKDPLVTEPRSYIYLTDIIDEGLVAVNISHRAALGTLMAHDLLQLNNAGFGLLDAKKDHESYKKMIDINLFPPRRSKDYFSVVYLGYHQDNIIDLRK